jgi:hypothetical protein
LEFSTDIIAFDTVFTSIGSTTLWLQVYNRSDKDVDIQTIELVGGKASPFRMNVSGDTSLLQHNVRLRAKDSLFIFVNVTINPNDETNPFVVIDFIRFSFNNRTQQVALRAFGQNAFYHLPTDTLEILCPIDDNMLRIPYSIAVPSDFIDSKKPHIVYGYLLVQNGDVLILNAGTHLHFAPNSGLIVATGGSLRVNGSFENRVIFDGMRTDAGYRNTTAQWDRIWFSGGSVDHRIDWAIIRNGKTGLLIDSTDYIYSPLIIENTVIDNMLNHGMFAQNATIFGTNLQVSNCGDRLLALIGGSYRFVHCTFANFFSTPGSFRRYASILLGNTSLHPMSRADFTSCIIYGSLQEELEIRVSSAQNINFSYCNIRTRINATDPIFQNCLFNINPHFRRVSNIDGDFDIALPTSGVIGKGSPSPSILFDLKNRPRPHAPTIGAYEFTEL